MGKVNFCKKSFFFMKKFRAFAILTNRSCLFFRSYDKSIAQIARHFYHVKFLLETCI